MVGDSGEDAMRTKHQVARRAAVVGCLVLALAAPSAGQPAAQDAHPDIQLFLDAGVPGGPRSRDAFEQLGAQWRDGYAGIVWDLAWLLRPPSQGFVHFFTLIGFLQEQTGQRFGGDLASWQQWIWSQPYDPHPDHGFFKGQWYSQIDPRFAEFFPRGVTSLIRLDEIEWGGVGVNGIPPLEYPARIAAADADYMADDHIVFGIALNGEAGAYPKRILAWHEMALDRLGGVELTIVYCTLCGTVIPFESVADGRRLTFGTSGLLYRSNKLMFDHETKSLWNTFEGVPVVGELAGSDLQLTPARRGDDDVGGMAAAASRDDRPFPRHRSQAQLRGGRRLPDLLRQRRPDVCGLAHRRALGQQGRSGGAASARPGAGGRIATTGRHCPVPRAQSRLPLRFRGA